MNIRQYQTNGYGRYAVRLKQNRTLIGMCGFLNEAYGIDFGYRYSKNSWGKGYGFEAAKEVLEYGFSKLIEDITRADCRAEFRFYPNS